MPAGRKAAAATSRKSRVKGAAALSKKDDKQSRDQRRVKSAETTTLSFDYYLTEGNTYMNNGDFNRAIIGYSKALNVKPDHKACLLLRSQCFLQLGDTKSALLDASNSLSDDKNFIKGIQQKADVLYQMGEFEQSLVLYHRGNKLRPEMRSFHLGIQLCKGAIDNSIGEKSGVHLNKSGDLSFFTKLQQTKEPSEKRPGALERGTSKVEEKQDKKKPRSSEINDKTMKQLLEQLYVDKRYLEKLLAETERVNSDSKTSDDIAQLSTSCLDYLDTRAIFWQQKEPTYSRDRNHQLQGRRPQSTSSSVTSESDATCWILHHLRIIDDEQSAGEYKKSLERAEKVLKRTVSFSETEVPRRVELEAHLHSYIGNAHLELGQIDDAMKHHKHDYDLAKQHNLPDAKSRSIDNTARVFVRQHKYREAIKLFEDRIPSTSHALERTWLYHEIGRCYLELDQPKKSLQFGEKSLSAAEEAEDLIWQLNASVVIAQSHVKLCEFSEALETFEHSLDLAKCNSDEHAVDAIKSAINDVNERIKNTSKEEKEDSYSSDDEVNIPKDSPRQEPADETKSPRQEPADKNKSPHQEPADKNKSPRQEPADKTKSPRQEPADKNKSPRQEPADKTKSPRQEPADKNKSPRQEPVDVDKNKSPRQEPADKNKSEPAARPEQHDTPAAMTSYKVTIKLSDIENADSDVRMYIELVGDRGATRRIELEPTGNTAMNRDTDNVFNIEAIDVGLVSKLILGHSNTVGGNGPHISQVHVHSVASGNTAVFHCHRWFDKQYDDKRTERELVVMTTDNNSPRQCEYNIKVKTSDEIGAGTDAKVFIQLNGDNGQTDKLLLDKTTTHNNNNNNNNNLFEKGQTDEFQLNAPNIGQIRSVRIGQDNSHFGAGWKLDDVTVHCSGTNYHFTANRWLDKNEGDKKTEIELLAD